MITFKSILKSREDNGETKLHTTLQDIWNNAHETWLNQLNTLHDSYNGFPHINNVEKHLDDMVPNIFKKKFSSTEIFILLSSVLFHDLGKLNSSDMHSENSCLRILKDWAYLKIPNEDLARWIAIISCSHTWDKPFPKDNRETLEKPCLEDNKKCKMKDKKNNKFHCYLYCEEGKNSELDTLFHYNDGPVRLKWLSALLRIADEVDNQVKRTVPYWLKGNITDINNYHDDFNENWRRKIYSIVFDPFGKCIKLQTKSLEKDWRILNEKIENNLKDIYKELKKNENDNQIIIEEFDKIFNIFSHELILDNYRDKNYEGVKNDLNKIFDLIINNNLIINLKYKTDKTEISAIEIIESLIKNINNYFFANKIESKVDENDPDNNTFCSEIARAKESLEKLNKVLDNWSKVLSEIGFTYEKSFIEILTPVNALISADSILDYEKKKLKNIGISVEPAIDDNKNYLEKTINAIKKIKNSIINTDKFSWYSIAEKAGITSINLVKLLVKRIHSLIECKEKNKVEKIIKYNLDKFKAIFDDNTNLSFNITPNGISVDKINNVDINKINKIIRAIIKFKETEQQDNKYSWDSITKDANISSINQAIFLVKSIHTLINNNIKENDGDKNRKKKEKKYILNRFKKISIKNFSITSNGILFDNGLSSKSVKENKEIDKHQEQHIISTGIDKLDELICPDWFLMLKKIDGNDKLTDDIKPKFSGGFYFPTINEKTITPIIAINGSSGQGKSTLSLQIACNLISTNNKDNKNYNKNLDLRIVPEKKEDSDLINNLANELDWTCLYYCLEQSPEEAMKQMEEHGYFGNEEIKEKIINLEVDFWDMIQKEGRKIVFASLTPTPSYHQNINSKVIFAKRLSELESSIMYVKKLGANPFYFIDSLTAFSHEPLTRRQINKLFDLFRENEIPLLITLEKQLNWVIKEEEHHYNIAKYLSDIVINLEAVDIDNYYRQTIEVEKTRYNRRILGKHLMKLKSTNQPATTGFDNRTGIVVYPSIHNHIVNSRNIQVKNEEKDFLNLGFDCENLPVYTKHDDKEKIYSIKSNSCIVVSGPYGGHKFALGFNLLIRDAKKIDPEKKLIVSFSEENEIDLNHVALFSDLIDAKTYYKSNDKEKTSSMQTGSKIWETKYGKDEKDDDKQTYLKILNFRTGQIMPEEFLYIFNEYLTKNDNIDSVLFVDTSHLRTRFPFLSKEKLFLPSLVDILKNKKKYSIFIDVTEDNKPNDALLSAADCRIYVERSKIHWGNVLRVENIRGKDYRRGLKAINIKQDETKDKNNILEIKPELQLNEKIIDLIKYTQASDIDIKLKEAIYKKLETIGNDSENDNDNLIKDLIKIAIKTNKN